MYTLFSIAPDRADLLIGTPKTEYKSQILLCVLTFLSAYLLTILNIPLVHTILLLFVWSASVYHHVISEKLEGEKHHAATFRQQQPIWRPQGSTC